jgi:hypothetical protein
MITASLRATATLRLLERATSGERDAPTLKRRPLGGPAQHHVGGSKERCSGELVTRLGDAPTAIRLARLELARRESEMGPTLADRRNRSGRSIVVLKASAVTGRPLECP